MTLTAPWRAAALGLVLGVALACSSPDLGPFRVERVAELGDAAGPGAIPTWPRVSARHPGGFRIVVPQSGSTAFQPMAFDDGGNFLGLLDAPSTAESSFVQPLFTRLGPDGTIWVFDAAARVLVFDAMRRYQRTVALPIAPWDAVVLADGRLAVTSSAYGTPLPWFLLDRDGRVVRRFGDGGEVVPSPRRIVAGHNGTVWTLTMTHRQRIEHWDTAGTLLTALEPTSTWFTSYDRITSPSDSSPPQSTIQDGWVDADGRLWLVGKAADVLWRSGLGSSGISIVKPDQVYDTVVEVRDPDTGALVESARFDVSYPFVVEPGILMRPRVIEGGWFRAELVEVSLVAKASGDRTPAPRE
ncbi:MAG TPA: hypothetical protein VFN22_10550 [Gemmatimonadales bacterium]|nr:hypothetical protein [Gemmatimonadales bacterium]